MLFTLEEQGDEIDGRFTICVFQGLREYIVDDCLDQWREDSDLDTTGGDPTNYLSGC